eukprot:TRINITY_DN5670_c0_g1_i1.p1 TRINITY_DN5670_c0_g1~~TRINITY_DN5670_c0_g1_i1.p1  ORF type:complete len:1300 (-),score=446.15 TRINITY_DN5670_c0_g1_i1:113-4012(-)
MADPKNSSMYGSGGPMRSSGSSSHRPTPYERNGGQKSRGLFGAITSTISSWFGGGSSSSNDAYRDEDQTQNRTSSQPVPATPPTYYAQPKVTVQPSSPKELLEKTLPPKLSEEQAQELFAVISARLPDVAPPRVATLPVPKPQVVRPSQQNVARPTARMHPAPVTPHDITKLVMDKRSPERAAYRQQVANRATPGQRPSGEPHRDPNSAFRTPHRGAYGQGVGTTVVPSRYESTPAPGGYFYRPGGANATPRVRQQPQIQPEEEEEQALYYQPGPTSSTNPRKRVARRSPPREYADAGEYQHAYDRPPVKRRAVDANRSYEEYNGTPAPFKGSRVDPSTITGSPIHMSTQAQKIFNSIEKMSTPFLEPSPVITSHKVVEYYRERERELQTRPGAHDDLELPPSTSIIPVTSSQKKRKRDVEVAPPTRSPWADDAEEDEEVYSSSRKARKTGEETKVTTARAEFKAPAAKGSFQFSDSTRFKSAMAETTPAAPKRGTFPLASDFAKKKPEQVIALDDDEEEDNDFVPAADEEEDDEEMEEDGEEDSQDGDASGAADEEEEKEEAVEKPKSVFGSKESPKDVFAAAAKGSPFTFNAGSPFGAKTEEKPEKKEEKKEEKNVFGKKEETKADKPAFGFGSFGATKIEGPATEVKPFGSLSVFPTASPTSPGLTFDAGFKLNVASKDSSEKDSDAAKEKQEKEQQEKEEKERKEKEEKEKKAKEEEEKKQKEEKERKEKEEKERLEKEKKEAEERAKKEAEERAKKEAEEKKKAEETKPVGFSFGGSFDASKSSVLSQVMLSDGAEFKAPVASFAVSSVLKLDAAPDASFDKTKISFGVPAATPAAAAAATPAASSGKDEAPAAAGLFGTKPVDIFGFGPATTAASADAKKETTPAVAAAAPLFSVPKPAEAKDDKPAAFTVPTFGTGTVLGSSFTAPKKADTPAAETKADAPNPFAMTTPAIKEAAPTSTSAFTFGTSTSKDAASKSLTGSSAFAPKDTPAATTANPFGAAFTPPTSTPSSEAPLFGGAGNLSANPFEKKVLDAPVFGGAAPASSASPAPAAGFGGFAQTSTPAASTTGFGGAPFGSTSTSTPAFGGGASGFAASNPFDTLSSTPSPQPAAATPAPSFGGFNATTNADPFGGSSTSSGFGGSPFGGAAAAAAPASTPFGGSGLNSNPFGGQSGSQSSSNGFGGAPFGSPSPSPSPSFGDSGFGGSQTAGGFATPFGSQQPQTQAPAFGAGSPFGGGSFGSGAPAAGGFAAGSGGGGFAAGSGGGGFAAGSGGGGFAAGSGGGARKKYHVKKNK